MTDRSTITRIAALLAAATLLLAGCQATPASPTAQAPTAQQPTGAPTSAPTDAATAEPTQGTTPAPTEAATTEPTEAAVSGTVTFWHGYNEVETDKLESEVIPAFQALHTGITVETQAIPYDDLRQKLVTGIAGGELPDVLRADIIWVPEFAELGALMPLDTEMSDFQAYADQMFAGPLSTNEWEGSHYGLPLDTNTRVLFYNTAVFAEAGIDAAPTTIEELEAAFAQINALGPERYGYAEGGPGAWSVLPWIWSFGGGITDEGITTASGVLNGPETVAAVQKLVDWLEQGYLSPGILGGGIATSDAIAQGQAATVLEGPWMPPIFAGQYPDLEYELALVPAGPAGSSSVVGGEDIVVFQSTENKEAALAFVRFMLSEETQRTMGTVGQMPVLESLAGDPALPEYYAVFQEQLQTAKARTPHPAWPRIDEAISNGVLLALRGEASVQEALDDAAATVDSLLAE